MIPFYAFIGNLLFNLFYWTNWWDVRKENNYLNILNKGKSVYDGDFKSLVQKINPRRRLIFEFDKSPDDGREQICIVCRQVDWNKIG